MLEIAAWLAAIELLGLLALPILNVLAPRLPDRGYTLAKPVGLLLLFYPLWLLASLTIVPNSLLTLMALLLGLAAASGIVAWRLGSDLWNFLQREWRVIVLTEVVFLGVFALWVMIKSHDPAINHTEQPMDLAFLNATVVSDHFPPQDPWLAGETVSYYYFGYLMFGGLARLTGVSTAVGYNLALALVAALAAAGTFGLAMNLVRLAGGSLRASAASGLVGVFLLLGIANLESGLEFMRASGSGSPWFWQWVDIKGLDGPSVSTAWYPSEPGWWWWRATRVIDTVRNGASLDYTITEFPFFSFLLGDLHPHVMSLPFVLMFSGLALNFLLGFHRGGMRGLISRATALEVVAVALALGALGFINLWDLPVFAGLFAGVALVRAYHIERALPRAVATASLTAIPVLLLALLLYLPFYLSFGSQAKGILPVQTYVTRPFHFLVIWGFLLLIVLPLVVGEMASVLGRGRGHWRTAVSSLGLVLLPWLVWVLVELVLLGGGPKLVGMAWGRLVHLLPLVLLATAAMYVVLCRLQGVVWEESQEEARGGGPRQDREGLARAFPLMLLSLAVLLLIGPELFYLVDVFNNRMNTMFKLYYHAWALLAVVGAYALYYLASRYIRGGALIRLLGYGWIGVFGLGVVVSIYYPVAATHTKTGGLAGSGTLDGLAYVATESSGELRGIQWLKENHRAGDRIIEAVGDDYSSYGRVSASTGIPTVLGWMGHEEQWRGSRQPFEGRPEAVQRFYQANDPQVAREILLRYGVTYIIVGPRERARYGILDTGKFEALGKEVFREGDMVIYRVRE